MLKMIAARRAWVLGVVLTALTMPMAVSAQVWYEGGNLHQKGALDWQEATYNNKLATAGDFVAAAFNNGSLSDQLAASIKTVDDIKPLAVELVKQLDDAFLAMPDARKNRSTYANQRVDSSAAMLMIMMGWLK